MVGLGYHWLLLETLEIKQLNKLDFETFFKLTRI